VQDRTKNNENICSAVAKFENDTDVFFLPVAIHRDDGNLLFCNSWGKIFIIDILLAASATCLSNKEVLLPRGRKRNGRINTHFFIFYPGLATMRRLEAMLSQERSDGVANGVSNGER